MTRRDPSSGVASHARSYKREKGPSHDSRESAQLEVNGLHAIGAPCLCLLGGHFDDAHRNGELMHYARSVDMKMPAAACPRLSPPSFAGT